MSYDRTSTSFFSLVFGFSAVLALAVCFIVMTSPKRTLLASTTTDVGRAAQHPAMPALRQLGLLDTSWPLEIRRYEYKDGSQELTFDVGMSKIESGFRQGVVIRTIKHGSGGATFGPKTEICSISVTTMRHKIHLGLTDLVLEQYISGSHSSVVNYRTVDEPIGRDVHAGLVRELLPVAEQLLAYAPTS